MNGLSECYEDGGNLQLMISEVSGRRQRLKYRQFADSLDEV
jgi:hypothetical protein